MATSRCTFSHGRKDVWDLTEEEKVEIKLVNAKRADHFFNNPILPPGISTNPPYPVDIPYQHTL